MADLKQRYLYAEQGRTLKQWFAIRNPLDNTVYDLDAEGYTSGELQVRDATFSDGGVLLLGLTTAGGGVVFSYIADDGAGNSWTGYIYASAVDMNIALWSDAVYELIATHSGGTVETISRGPAMLIPKVVD